MDAHLIQDVIRRWVETVVVDLNLCPFARRVVEGGLVRYTVTDADDPASLYAVLAEELRLLKRTPAAEVETSLLIHPKALPDFLDFNDFLGDAEDLLVKLRLDGVIQIVGFHPQFQFDGTQPGDVENYTNRSPFPMLHLLREESVTQAVDDVDDMDEIPRRNVELLNRLGLDEMLRRLKACTDDSTERP